MIPHLFYSILVQPAPSTITNLSTSAAIMYCSLALGLGLILVVFAEPPNLDTEMQVLPRIGTASFRVATHTYFAARCGHELLVAFLVRRVLRSGLLLLLLRRGGGAHRAARKPPAAGGARHHVTQRILSFDLRAGRRAANSACSPTT